MSQINAVQLICPICSDKVDKLLYRFHVENEREVIQKLKKEYPNWSETDGICGRCVDHYQSEIVMAGRILPAIGPFFPIRSADDFIILPTPLRLNADPRFTGKGVTICFIDSGFCAHPDLVETGQRIKAYVDITLGESTLSFEEIPVNESSWHGTMTSVVCAGDGYLSKGLYKGIATGAELVLLKVQDSQNKISTVSLVKALTWVLHHHMDYGIRIVNMSVSADENISSFESEIDILIERLFDQGVLVVAAVGNDENGIIKPPANALNVISVGGIDDGNRLEGREIQLYHSAYGTTIDGYYKPELVANSIWLAAPILPGTPEQKKAAGLHSLLQQNQDLSAEDFKKNLSTIGVDTHLIAGENQLFDITFREYLLKRCIQETKFFSADYMHVDGTSFAAPIVCSVIAQLLEADPSLPPKIIRDTLFKTANRFPSLPAIRQGFGYIRPRHALFEILKREVTMKPKHESPYINKRRRIIEFHMQNGCAQQISLVGSFNHWAQDVLLMEPSLNGVWKIEIPMLPKGRYRYKFFIDDRMWVEDVENPLREPDGLNGWNSILELQ